MPIMPIVKARPMIAPRRNDLNLQSDKHYDALIPDFSVIFLAALTAAYQCMMPAGRVYSPWRLGQYQLHPR